MRGDSELTGSWKIICMRARKARRASPRRSSTSIGPVPSLKVTEPLSALMARMISLLTLVLPLPLSPTSPRHSPRRMSKLTSSTATTRSLRLPSRPDRLPG